MRLGWDSRDKPIDLPLDEPARTSRFQRLQSPPGLNFNEIAGMIRQGLTLRESPSVTSQQGTFCANASMIISIIWNTGMEPAPAMFHDLVIVALPSTLTDFVEKWCRSCTPRRLPPILSRTTLREHLAFASGNRYVASGSHAAQSALNFSYCNGST